MSEPARIYAVPDQPESADEAPLLLLPAEQAYVTENPTGLTFAPNTPLEVWGGLTERLARQHKRLEWAIGDALQFGERRYGDTYTAWVSETGLAENTLATLRWVAGRIEPLRRREDVGWSHHREVAALDPPRQDEILERAADQGLTRWEVRQAVRAEQEAMRGRAITAAGEPLDDDVHIWVPDIAELTADARAALEAHAPGGRHRLGYVAGFLRALVWTESRDAFLPGRWQDD